MNTLLLPDLFAMVVLLGVLWQVRRRYPQHDIRLWMAGLLLILLECVARILYNMRLPQGLHRAAHITALNAYLIAGVLFLRSALSGMRRLPRSTQYAVLYTLPGALLLTEYAMGVTSPVIYVLTAGAGMLLTAISSLVLRRPVRHLAGLVAVWIPVLCAEYAKAPRLAAYLLLAGVYLATAAAFAW
ncbi:MAG: hypothetical protein INR71_13560, partial [Terriglobus roseus]|nr:hypothetical protein [Terriglobus roseus]